MALLDVRRFDDLGAEALTSLLRESGTLRAGAVKAAQVEPIGIGAGFLGQVARLRLIYEARDETAPTTLVGKLPTVDPGGREICRIFKFYEREIRFYRDIARAVPLRVPRCYATLLDIPADNYLLLLEDLQALPMGDDVAGCSAVDAEAAIRSLGQLHATWWNSPNFERLDWIPASNAPVHLFAEPTYQNALVPFLEMFGDHISPKMRAVTEQLRTHVIDLLNLFARPPVTLVHGDYRLDNLFFGDSGVAVIDWQISYHGRGAFDIAYFLSGCLEPSVRRAEEMRLLRLWYDLAVPRSSGYTFDEALIDYRRSVLFCHVYTVIATGSLNPANERGMAVFKAWLRRRSAAIEELDAGALMPA